MKNKILLFCALSATLLSSCEGFLDEEPMSFLAPENTLNSTYGFELASTGLYVIARTELSRWSSAGSLNFGAAIVEESLQIGTDVSTQGQQVNESNLRIFEEYTFDTGTTLLYTYWKYYYNFIANCNSIITAAEENEVVWDDESDQNHFIAEARFFRAFSYRALTYLYGDVPWVDKVETSFRTDFTRTPVATVISNAIEDLKFAVEYLPEDPASVLDGKITKWVAAHLLAELYIVNGDYDLASAAAQSVISSGYYELMTERFGNYTAQDGDPYSDIFLTDNANRSSGNKETLFVYQMQYQVNGGGDTNMNWTRRSWCPYYSNISGFVLCDSLGGRSIGQMAPMQTWVDSYEDQDMRASKYNLKREYWYNDVTSEKYGQKAEITDETIRLGTLYATFTKFYFGVTAESSSYSGTHKDYIVFRLSETYLLKAEADILRGNTADAAEAINAVRERAQATPITAAEATIDFLLDERSRELIGEERRRFTLLRTGKLIERVKQYNERSKDLIQDHHILWPIPQTVIDGNTGAEFPQNPGYAS